jgi:LemA protein
MWVLAAIAIIVLAIPAVMYNSLIAKRNQVANIFATTDAILKKRYDLIPNIVATVKGYVDHERTVLKEITAARAQQNWEAIAADDKVEIDNAVSKAIGGMRVAVENYPDLKANENFMHLQRTLNELEEQISAARRAYNASVTDYNNAVEMFPTNIIASMGNFQRKKFFEIPHEQRQNVEAKTLLNG